MAKVECCICGKNLNTFSFDCWPLQTKVNGQRVYECKECLKKYKGMGLEFTADGKAKVIVDSVFRRKCSVCGHLFSYNVNDLNQNNRHARNATLSSVAALGGALGGAYAASAVDNANAQGQLDKIVDYNRCPKCGSTSLRALSAEEWADEWAKKQAASEKGSAPAVSTADELKKFKELLDSGVISQEEFDAKKKELLGL